jgi:hypothetical protein
VFVITKAKVFYMPADSFDQIYTVEAQVESAIKYLFELIEIPCIGTTDAMTEFQNVRPRIEIEYTHSDMNQSNAAIAPYYRSRLFGGQLALLVVSNGVDEPNGGILLHSVLRAKVRNVFAKLRHDLISTYTTLLPYHTIENVMEQGTSPTMDTDGGVITSQMAFEFQVSVKPDAWPTEN